MKVLAMFQSFTDSVERDKTSGRMADLAHYLKTIGCEGFFIPRSDEFQGEYVGPHSERLAWLTGFTGSAGMGLMFKGRMHLFVDGRYTLQAANQTPADCVTVEDLVATPPALWLQAQKLDGLHIAFDPWLHTIQGSKTLRQAMAKANAELRPLPENPIDRLWIDQPQPPSSMIVPHLIEFAGKSAQDKLAELCAQLRQDRADAYLLADPTETAWLFNIRAKDVPHTPIALCFALVFASGQSIIYLDEKHFSPEALAQLPHRCTCMPLEKLGGTFRDLAAQKLTLLLDEGQTPDAIRTLFEQEGGTWMAGTSPVILARALKNTQELEGARAAHLRDGAAMCSFLAWLDGQAPGTVDEITAAKTLEAARQKAGMHFRMPLQDISFDTISGAGPNGAIIHYRVTEATNRTLNEGELFLLDSGGQYQDGTTDITRTIAIGAPSPQMKSDFTRVLKGMIAISLAQFPRGTRGMDLDPFARHALWQVGLDYAHGTGHGVGAFLSVHEGPQGISKRAAVPLEPGMILSNEPGCYREGQYGIRIENLVIVQLMPHIKGAMMPVLGFETLTLCPIDRRLIEPDLLSLEERSWLNSYHAHVRASLSPHLDPWETDWLIAATEPL